MKEFTNRLALHAEWVLCFFLLLGGVLAAAAGIRYILRRRQKKKSVKGRAEWLYTFLSDNPFQTYIFLRGADAFPFFVSENVEQVFGLTKSEMDTDVFALARCMKPEEAHKLERQYRNWNRREPMAAEFSFVNPQNERRGRHPCGYNTEKKKMCMCLCWKTFPRERRRKRRFGRSWQRRKRRMRPRQSSSQRCLMRSVHR